MSTETEWVRVVPEPQDGTYGQYTAGYGLAQWGTAPWGSPPDADYAVANWTRTTPVDGSSDY